MLPRFQHIPKISLAPKVVLLFVIPLILQLALLACLLLSQTETANFYPRRAMHYREMSNQEIDFVLNDWTTLRILKDALAKQALPSQLCQADLDKLLVAKNNLVKFWSHYAERRHQMVLIFFPLWFKYPEDVTWGQQNVKVYSIAYGDTAAAVAAAQKTLTHAASSDQAPGAPQQKTAALAARQLYDKANLDLQWMVHVREQPPFGPKTAAHERWAWTILLLSYSVFVLIIIGVWNWMFITNLLFRLSVINENCRRLAARQPLETRLPGKDEIARLDSAFHDMRDALNHSTQVHRLMMDKAQDFMCSLDKNGRIAAASASAISTLGYTSDELMGTRLIDVIHESAQENFREKLKSVAATKSRLSFEAQAVAKDGRAVEMLWSTAFFAADNTTFCITHDISETKHAERLQKELVQMVSHDLRSPLTSITGFHEFAERGLLGSFTEHGRAMLTGAQRSAQQLLALVNDLLEVERLDSGMLELTKADCEVQQIMDDALSNIRNQAAGKKIDILAQTSAYTVFGDGHRLTQILENLLANAIRLSPERSQIIVQATSEDDATTFSVTDFAGSLPMEYMHVLSEERSQLLMPAESQHTISLLKLTICRALVALHGGEMWIDTRTRPVNRFCYKIPGMQTPPKSKKARETSRDETIDAQESKHD